MAGPLDDTGNEIPPAPRGPRTPAGGRLVFGPLTESEADETARIYRDVFLADEPTSQVRAPDPARFLTYAGHYTRFLAGKHLSFVARDRESHEIAGFIFCSDITETPGSAGDRGMPHLEDFREVMCMIQELEDRYINPSETLRGTVLHIFQIGVGRKYRGRGIARDLIRRALANARDQGFRQALADCTGLASRRTFELSGFHEAGFFSYEQFSLDSDRFFAGLDGGIFLMVRDLEEA
jgi:ribosomal protein S18 acetylase RimI-like enzyme